MNSKTIQRKIEYRLIINDLTNKKKRSVIINHSRWVHQLIPKISHYMSNFLMRS